MGAQRSPHQPRCQHQQCLCTAAHHWVCSWVQLVWLPVNASSPGAAFCWHSLFATPRAECMRLCQGVGDNNVQQNSGASCRQISEIGRDCSPDTLWARHEHCTVLHSHGVTNERWQLIGANCACFQMVGLQVNCVKFSASLLLHGALTARLPQPCLASLSTTEHLIQHLMHLCSAAAVSQPTWCHWLSATACPAIAAASRLSVGSSRRKSFRDTSRSHPVRRKSCKGHHNSTAAHNGANYVFCWYDIDHAACRTPYCC